ncbi:efflux RND transporter permease subunit [Marinicellulosiphila megalodicopiae]|uniref:efflux RND transporter permease subunit n=1 Tax=Marinicellulosiphila megalodicopiae TaxID=2724896 RepID=UPI003BB1F5DD
MSAIIAASLDRARAVVLLFAVLFIIGIASFFSIPKENFPDVSLANVYVSVSLKGISPEDADNMLAKPLVQDLKTLEGLKTYSTTSSEGHASINLEFRSGVDIDDAIQDVKDAVDKAKSKLPTDADDPTVTEINLSELPVINISLSGNVDDDSLFDAAEELQEKIESIRGVLKAPINGLREEIVEIIVDPSLMASYNLSHAELIATVRNNNKLVTAGNIDTGAGRFAVKLPGLISTIEEILDLPIKTEGSTVVRFRDIATYQRTYKEPNTLARVNTKPSVTIAVSKSSGENLLEMIDEIKLVTEQITTTPSWPADIEVVISGDQSKDTRDSLNSLYNNVIFSSLLVFVVIVFFLGFRTATLVGLAIPTSFLVGIMVLNMMGVTLNMVVLFALLLTLGMLVDGAIVVTEYADRRMIEGANRKVAYKEASIRMSWPIIASTATTLSVFIPLLFWPGLMGGFMKYLPITALVTLGASLGVALIIIPTFGSIYGKPSPLTKKEAASLQASSDGDLNDVTGLPGLYLKMLTVLLKRPGITALSIVFVVFATFFVYVGSSPKVEFFPEQDSGMGQIVVKARGNLSLTERDEIVREVESKISSSNVIKAMTTTVYATENRNQSEDTIGFIQLEMIDWQQREPVGILMEKIIKEANTIAGVIVESQKAAQGPTAAVDIQMEFNAESAAELNTAMSAILKEINSNQTFINDEGVHQIASMVDSRPLPGIEWQITFDREAASRYNVSLDSVGSSLQMVTSGLKIGSFRPDYSDDELDINMRYPFNGRDLDQIQQLTISAQGQQVPLSNFVTDEAAPKKGTVVRTEGNLSINLDIDVIESANVQDVINLITTALEGMQNSNTLSSDVNFKFKGDQEQQAETGAFLGQALFASIFLMVFILLIQFNSFYQTFLIMVSIVLAIAGVLIGLLITEKPFGIVMTGVGIISLTGIVVNNNIILIDTFNVLRQSGLDAKEAVIRTCAQRIRPVMLTTITTILGLMPMAFTINLEFAIDSRGLTYGSPSSQMWTGLANAIASGLTFATILTLVFTPALLLFGAQFNQRRKANKQKRLELAED